MFLFKVVSEFFKKLHLLISTRHNDIIIPLFNFHLKRKKVGEGEGEFQKIEDL